MPRFTRYALSFAVPLVAAGAACAPGDEPMQEETGTAVSAGKFDQRKPKAPVNEKVLQIDTKPSCEETRYYVRRASRSCRDVPGAEVRDGVTYVPGTGGRFVLKPLLSDAAPAAMADKACLYVWKPYAPDCVWPDAPKLALAEDDRLVQRTGPPVFIPSGLGRCEVCGHASNEYMWAVYPEVWNEFWYELGGKVHHVENVSGGLYEAQLPSAVAPQSFTIIAGPPPP